MTTATATAPTKDYPPGYLDRLRDLLARAKAGQAEFMRARALLYAARAYDSREVAKCVERDAHSAELQIARLEEFIAMESRNEV